RPRHPGDPCRPRVRHHRREGPRHGHGIDRTPDRGPALARRAGRDRLGRGLLPPADGDPCRAGVSAALAAAPSLEARAAARPAAPLALPALHRAPWAAVLLALPLALLAVDPQWIWSGPWRDAWLYYGYFRDLPAY